MKAGREHEPEETKWGILWDFCNRVRDFLRRPSLKNLASGVSPRPKRLLLFIALLSATIATIYNAKAEKPDFVRLSKPELLTFEELVQLEKTEKPGGKLADRLQQLLQTPLEEPSFNQGHH
ncbi:MAG: hypothetical protein WB607_27640 [Candidatus Acidiferrum sp.]